MIDIMKVVGILSKNQIQAREILVSDVDDPTDYHTRRVALVETTVDGKDLAVASCSPIMVG